MLKNGLYEQVINKSLDKELAETDKLIQTAAIDPAEAAKVLSQYISEVVEKGLQNVRDNGGDVSSQVELVNKIVSCVILLLRRPVRARLLFLHLIINGSEKGILISLADCFLWLTVRKYSGRAFIHFVLC